MIDAFALIQNRGVKNSRLILVGPCALNEEVLARIRRYNFDDKILLISEIPHPKVFDVLTAADVGICPLPDLVWWRLSSPLKVYEYAAAGLLLLLTDIPPHKEFKGVAIYSPDTTPGKLAEAMIEIASMTRVERDRRKRAAVALASEASWEKRAEDFLPLLRALEN